jgi:hypothetical protein
LSNFEIRNVTADNVQVGDHNVQANTHVTPHALASRLSSHQALVRDPVEVDRAVTGLRRELESPNPDPTRIRTAVETLVAAADALRTNVADLARQAGLRPPR